LGHKEKARERETGHVKRGRGAETVVEGGARA